MKKRLLLASISLTFCLSVFAGKSNTWPNVEYSYAMVYLYNLDGELKGHHQILKNGKLDPTIEGKGKKLTADNLKALDKIFSSGAAIDELVNGLSGCYIPRHAIVYYDKKGKPVASMSICFECEGIRFYEPSYPRNHYASTPALVKKAEEKLEEIKTIISSLGFKTDYKAPQIQVEENLGVMYFTDSKLIDSLFPDKITIENYTNFFTDTNQISVTEHEKYTYGGDKYTFHTVLKGNSKLEFSGSSALTSLNKADVQGEDVTLLKNIKLGMRLEDVQSLFMVYDGIAYPEFIEVKNEEGTKVIVFHFNKNRLISYEIEVTTW